MQEKTLKIKNKLGFHARPAALFVKITSKYNTNIKVIKDDQEVDGKSIMGLLTLCAGEGSNITIIVDGQDEDKLLEELTNLIENKFYEQ